MPYRVCTLPGVEQIILKIAHSFEGLCYLKYYLEFIVYVATKPLITRHQVYLTRYSEGTYTHLFKATETTGCRCSVMARLPSQTPFPSILTPAVETPSEPDPEFSPPPASAEELARGRLGRREL